MQGTGKESATNTPVSPYNFIPWCFWSWQPLQHPTSWPNQENFINNTEITNCLRGQCVYTSCLNSPHKRKDCILKQQNQSSIRRQSSCSQSNHWCSNFETCDLNQRCRRMIMNHAIKLPCRMLLRKKNIPSTIKCKKKKKYQNQKYHIFDFIICCSTELNSSLSSAIYWFGVFGPHLY